MIWSSPRRTGHILGGKNNVLEVLPRRGEYHDSIATPDGDPQVPLNADISLVRREYSLADHAIGLATKHPSINEQALVTDVSGWNVKVVGPDEAGDRVIQVH